MIVSTFFGGFMEKDEKRRKTEALCDAGCKFLFEYKEGHTLRNSAKLLKLLCSNPF